jgi:hypothetical protein
LRQANITKTTTNRIKTTTNYCSGTIGKSKQVDIFAPRCSAVQLGRKDKLLTGVAGAFVEHHHLFTSYLPLAEENTSKDPLSGSEGFRKSIGCKKES